MSSEPLKLVFVDGQGQPRSLELSGRLCAGRAPTADIVVQGDGISREHCEFVHEGNEVLVRDLGSTNGTYVNGSRVKSARLKEGDTVVLGRILLRVEGSDGSFQEFRTTYIGSESVELTIDAGASYPPEELEPETGRRHLDSLYRILSIISSAKSAEHMLGGVLESILEVLRLDFGHVLLGESVDALRPVASRACDGRQPAPFSWTVVRRVLRESQAVLANDIHADTEFAASESIAAAGTLRIACAPVPVGGREGVLYVAARGTGHPLQKDDVAFLNAAARQIGLAADALRERENLARENELLKQSTSFPKLIGDSETMQLLREMIAKASAVKATVLITGESGTGKELVARGIHESSERAAQPFVALNCGALPASVVQSELFGHEKGAFTGADRQRIGLVELADKGTLFLDEVAELPPDVQVTLLRLLEEKRFYRVGGQHEIHCDVRFLAATNRDLDQLSADKSFRADLLYRLKVVEIRTPPLREHPEDMNSIADFLLSELARTSGRPVRSLAPEAQELLVRHRWPGNVRELRNVLERAFLLTHGEEIGPGDLAMEALDAVNEIGEVPLVSLAEIEKRHVARVLHATGWNKTRAAEILGVARITLYEKIKNYELKPRES